MCTNAVITRRTYLTDTRFIAVLEGEASLLAKCAEALENPVWGVWFGRKTCLPAAPLAPTLAATLPIAIQSLLSRLGFEDITHQNLAGQQEKNTDGTWFQSDQPLSFQKREFESRPAIRLQSQA